MSNESQFLGGVAFALLDADDVEARWGVWTAALDGLGIDQVNYRILNAGMSARLNAPVYFLSTMDRGSPEYKQAEGLDLGTPHMMLVRDGNLKPYIWGEGVFETLADPDQRKAVALTGETGLKTQLSIAMLDPFDALTPIGEMTLGSITDQKEELITLANLFHVLSIGEVRRKQSDADRLTVRERDVLSYIASGFQIEKNLRKARNCACNCRISFEKPEEEAWSKNIARSCRQRHFVQ